MTSEPSAGGSSYLESRNQEFHGLKPAWAMSGYDNIWSKMYAKNKKKVFLSLFLHRLNFGSDTIILAGYQWLVPAILPTQETEIRRIMVRSQPGQIVVRPYLEKTLHKKKSGGRGLVEWLNM
jgi:hypothetical protein